MSSEAPELPDKLLICTDEDESDFITWKPTGLDMDRMGTEYIQVAKVPELAMTDAEWKESLAEAEAAGVRKGLEAVLKAFAGSSWSCEVVTLVAAELGVSDK